MNNILARSKSTDKTWYSSIRQQVTRRRNHHKFHAGLKGLIWRLNAEINCPTMAYMKKMALTKQGVNIDEDAYLPKYTKDEINKLRQAKEILEELFDKIPYNNNTQKLIKIVEDYDRSKQNG